MILTALCDLHERLSQESEYGIAPPGYSTQRIGFKIVLREDGTLVDIQDARDEQNGKLRPRTLHVPGNSKPSGQGINPCFLWDNARYLLGHIDSDANSKDRKRIPRCFEASREYHISHQSQIDSVAYNAVCKFLAGWDSRRGDEFAILEEAKSFGVFQILGQTSYVHEDPAVRAWWDRAGVEESDAGDNQVCLATGKAAPVARVHEPKIKGVRGAQSSGALLVSFNESAYESYGHEQSYNAPVSGSAARAYAQALNALMEGPSRGKHTLQLDGTTLVFWTETPSETENVLASFLRAIEPDVQDERLRQSLSAFLQSVRAGRLSSELPDEKGTTFYMLGLAPNASRLAVTLFLRSSVGDLVSRLHDHHEALCIEPRWRGPECPAIWQLLRETVREGDNTNPLLESALLRSILTGGPYPALWFQSVIRRLRTERRVTPLKCASIRAFLTRNRSMEVPVSLSTERPDPGYRMGRLFAALEKTQAEALGSELNAGIRDRFYSSASATPAAVFPRLLRTYQHHLGKLEGGRRVNREKLVQEILSPLSVFPSHLRLEDQGLFALGYYHQWEAFFAPRTRPDSPSASDTEEEQR